MSQHQPLRKDAYSVRKSSAGLGLYAEQPIKKWQKIIEYIGERISAAEADKRGGKYLFEVNSRITIDGTARYNTARYINHSCWANAEPRENRARIFAYATKNIAADEEITYDYGQVYWDYYIKPHGCKCTECLAGRGRMAKLKKGKKTPPKKSSPKTKKKVEKNTTKKKNTKKTAKKKK